MLAFSPIKEMEEERKDFLKNLSANVLESNFDITIFEKRYDEVIGDHLSFCRKKNLDLYDYLLDSNPGIGDFDFYCASKGIQREFCKIWAG